MKQQLAYVKKAVIAGAGAGLAAGFGVAIKGGFTKDSIGQAIGAFIVAAVPVGFATWKARNGAKPGAVAPAAPSTIA